MRFQPKVAVRKTLAWRNLRLLLAGSLAALLSACGSGELGGGFGGNPLRATLVLFAEDQAGNDVHSFELTMTGATLVSSTGTQVPVLPAPVRLEWTSRSLAPTVLSITQVAPATYTGLNLVLASPEMRIFNSTTGQFSSFTPSLSASTVNLTINITLTANQVFGTRLDLDLAGSIDSTSQVTPRFTFVPTSFVAGELPGDIDDALGTVASIDTTNSRFTLTLNPAGTTITVETASGTRFEGITGLSALRAGDEVELDARLQSTGRFLAQEVEVENQTGKDQVRGLVLARTPATGTATSLSLLLLEENPSPPAHTGPNRADPDVGTILTVTLDANTAFRINQEEFDFASDLRLASFTFDRASLAPGQVVAIELANDSLLAERVALKETAIAGTVTSVGTVSFNLDARSAFYLPIGLDPITAQLTSNITEFEDLPQGLQVNQTVAARGLVFASPPTLVTKRVRLLAP